MKIAVMGAGGIGGYVGGRLAEAGQDVTLIARGAHLAALQAKGLRLLVPGGQVDLPGIRACDAPSEVGPVDLVLFTVKMNDAKAAAQAIVPLMGPNTRVVTLQNGIDGAAIVEAAVGQGRVSAGIIYLAAYIQEPGAISHPGGVHRIVLDPLAGDPVLTKLLALSAGLTDLEILASDNPRQTVWDKFVALAAFAGATCLVRGPIGLVYETPAALAFYRRLLDENLAVARAEGLAFPAGHREAVVSLFGSQPYEQKSSMLVDLEAGKPLELPWLTGRICALAQGHGIAVPSSDAVMAALMPHVGGRTHE